MDVAADMESLTLKKEVVQDNEGSGDEYDDSSEEYHESSTPESHEDSENEEPSTPPEAISEGSDEEGDHSENELPEKVKPIQIWTPHVKKIGANAYGRKIHSRARNKAKAETKKGHRKRKQLTEVNLAIKGDSVW